MMQHHVDGVIACRAAVLIGGVWRHCRAVNPHQKHWATCAPWPTSDADGVRDDDGRIIVQWVDL